MMRVLGIDEAGRGCVLGPLVVAGYLCVTPDDDVLRAAGANDSKKLSHDDRWSARDRLAALGEVHLHAIEPDAIDEGNLNHLEELAIIELVRRFEPDLVLLDALGHPRTLPKVAARLAEAVHPLTPEWTIEPKADATYAVVGAASIFAKTTRDARITQLEAEWGPLGSGYPSDPVTKAWLRSWYASGRDWPDFVRTRWGSIAALAQQSLF